jgi:hypothetical protein
LHNLIPKGQNHCVEILIRVGATASGILLSRVCKRLQPEQDHADVDHGEILLAMLFISNGDAPGLLETADQTPRSVALLDICG